MTPPPPYAARLAAPDSHPSVTVMRRIPLAAGAWVRAPTPLGTVVLCTTVILENSVFFIVFHCFLFLFYFGPLNPAKKEEENERFM